MYHIAWPSVAERCCHLPHLATLFSCFLKAHHETNMKQTQQRSEMVKLFHKFWSYLLWMQWALQSLQQRLLMANDGNWDLVNYSCRQVRRDRSSETVETCWNMKHTRERHEKHMICRNSGNSWIMMGIKWAFHWVQCVKMCQIVCWHGSGVSMRSSHFLLEDLLALCLVYSFLLSLLLAFHFFL